MAAPLYRDGMGYIRCGQCRGVRVCIYRNARKPDSNAKRKWKLQRLARLQGKAQFKRWLRTKLKKLRVENDDRLPERYDMDITPECHGFEAALDAVEDLLNERRAVS